MIKKLPEHSNVKTILFIENHPNPLYLSKGGYWVLSYDGCGELIQEDGGVCIGCANFPWQGRDVAKEYLEDLKGICPDAKVEYLSPEYTSDVLKTRQN